MTGNPTNQVFQCIMQTDFPASVLSNNDVIGVLNDIPSVALNDVIGSIFSADFFINTSLDVTSSSVTGSRWINYNDHAALQYNLNVTSDPVTVTQVEEVIFYGAAALATAIVVGGLLAGVAPGLILLGLFITGVLAFIAVIVVAIGGIASTGAGQILLLLGGVATIGILGFAAYQYFKNPEVKRHVDVAAGRLSKKVSAALK